MSGRAWTNPIGMTEAPDEEQPLRSAVVGYGAIGRHHARVLNDLPGMDLVAIVDPVEADNPGSAEAPIVATLSAALDMELDVAVVAVPTNMHEYVAAPLIEAGVNVLIEKPLAATEASAERLCVLVEETGVFAAVGHIERCNPAFDALRRSVAAGEIGRPRWVSTTRVGPSPSRSMGVGVALDLGSHDIDLAQLVAGPITELSAQHLVLNDGGHEDLIVASGSLGYGAVLSMEVNWLSPVKRRTISVLGDDGLLEADLIAQRLFATRNSGSMVDGGPRVALGKQEELPVMGDEPLVAQLRSFRDAMRGRRDGRLATVREGAAIVELAARMATPSPTRAAALVLSNR